MYGYMFAHKDRQTNTYIQIHVHTVPMHIPFVHFLQQHNVMVSIKDQ